MDPAKFREAVGLDDLTDDEVMAALAKAGFIPQSDPPAEPAPVAASAPPAAKPAAAKPGTMVIEASAWDALQERTKTLEARDALRRRDERDQIITTAVQEGKFAPARREHWVRLWDADPEGTRTVIGTLAKNVMPVMAAGYAGDGEVEEDDLDREIARLSAPSGKRG
jgi:phage I-like protein